MIDILAEILKEIHEYRLPSVDSSGHPCETILVIWPLRTQHIVGMAKIGNISLSSRVSQNLRVLRTIISCTL